MVKLLNHPLFGQNIRKIRLSRGLTQEQTVARLQLLGSTICRGSYTMIEAGTRHIFLSDFVGLKQVFGVDYAAFFEGVPSKRFQRDRASKRSEKSQT